MKTLDWNATEEKARRMTVAELHYALLDIQKTLPLADARDRENGGATCDGGFYRDEASVYRAEIERRRETRWLRAALGSGPAFTQKDAAEFDGRVE
jgi:hypothetical protein